MSKVWGYLDIVSKSIDNLTDQQKRFVDAYLGDENLSIQESAIAAGYTEKYASSQAYQLLRNPRVKHALDKEMAARARRTRITHDRVLREIASIAFSNIDDYVVDSGGNITLRDGADVRAMKAVSSVKKTIVFGDDKEQVVKVELKLWDKPKAMEMLSRHLNLFKDDQQAGAPKLQSLSDEDLAERLERAAKKLKGKNHV